MKQLKEQEEETWRGTHQPTASVRRPGAGQRADIVGWCAECPGCLMKLLRVGVVEEVARSSLRCVNPLTVVQNTSKKRLCIDLSHCFNEQCDAQSFKIEYTAQALASINPDDYMFTSEISLLASTSQ